MQADSDIPDKIARLIPPKKDDERQSDTFDGIWPVIWDFAGQAVYRASHPIFMSREAVYVLVCDLTKDLFSTALCKVKEDGVEEVEIPAPDSSDTNLDHILRWMDLVHSLRQSESDYKLPPLVLVGTHADKVRNPENKMDDLKTVLMCNAEDAFQRIAKTLTINNTLAGYLSGYLFTRLLVIFGEWASSRTTCEEPQLFANAARFFIGKLTSLSVACCKTVIKIHIWTIDNSNPVESEPGLSSEVFRILKDALKRLREECHWLRAVSWEFCGQCRLCPGKVDPRTSTCFRHQERECCHDDCAHYVFVDSSPFCCKDGKGPDLRIPQTWIQVLQSWQEQSCNKGKRTADSGLEELSNDPPPSKCPRIVNYSVKEGTPSDDELEELSQRVAEAWKPLGRRLNIDEAKLTAFHKENEEYSEKAYKMLLYWKERDSTAATYLVLYNALCHKLVQRKLLAEELCCD